jgi:hypothetical protein
VERRRGFGLAVFFVLPLQSFVVAPTNRGGHTAGPLTQRFDQNPAMTRLLTLLTTAVVLFAVTGCGMQFKPAPPPPPRESVFGPGGITFGAKPPGTEPVNPAPSGILVNAYLWQAALEMAADKPILQADPHGGVILVDWYSLTAAPNERFRINLAITDEVLASTSLRVDLLRQTRNQQGDWVTQPADVGTEQGLENSLLARAQALRLAAEGPVAP